MLCGVGSIFCAYPATVTSASKSPSRIELTLDRPADGGAAVGRDASGRVVFCQGGLAGETVVVEVHTAKKSFARGSVVEVLDPSPQRRPAQCPTHSAGCGGCDLAHVEPGEQLRIKRHVVRDSLIRIARIEEGQVEAALLAGDSAVHTPIPSRYRTTVRMAIDGDRVGYRKRSSHDVVHPESCLVVHQDLEALIGSVRFGQAAGSEATIRVSAHSNEAVIVVDGDPLAVEVGASGVRVTGHRAAPAVKMTESAGNRLWQVSAASFFQAGPEVASALVDAVAFAAGDLTYRRLVDAFSGVGLFAGTVGAEARSVVAVEQSTSSTSDARINLADQDAVVITSGVEEWKATPADTIIADPARSGLGADAVASLMGCGADRFVLVSCDTGSLGRDVQLLEAEGYALESVQIVDAFHDTSHAETVVSMYR